MYFDSLLIASIFIVALFYASIGHGGASGYLAVMSLFAVEIQLMRPSALILNLFVSGIAFYHYNKNGFFKWRLFYPFAIASIPASFVGGLIAVDPGIYKIILGISLVVAVIRMLFFDNFQKEPRKQLSIFWGILIGTVLGLISGIIGIGGGIFLSPIILLMGWADMKETAAVSALFIFVNSTSGMLGMWSSGMKFSPQIYVWVIAAVIGGMIGSYLGSTKISIRSLKYVLSLVLLFASFKLIV